MSFLLNLVQNYKKDGRHNFHNQTFSYICSINNDKDDFMNIRLQNYTIIICAICIFASCGKETDKTASPSTILSTIQQEADIVTTELTIKKIAYYDSSLSEHISITDPSTWKYGERKCIVPVEVKIKYGYDLREMTLDNVKVNDSLRVVEVTLPEPKVIDSGYSTDIDYSKVVSISTGLRDQIGHETIEKIRKQAYESVMKEDFRQIVGSEIRNNARSIINSLVQCLGFERCEVREE